MRSKAITVLALALSLSGCSYFHSESDTPEWAQNVKDSVENASTTSIGAAAGAVLGGGVGAIVGSTAGDAGTGLVLGSIAGAATGAAIGSKLEEQENSLLEQKQKVERQEEEIAARRKELQELRKNVGDRYDPRVKGKGVPYSEGYQGSPRAKPFAAPGAAQSEFAVNQSRPSFPAAPQMHREPVEVPRAKLSVQETQPQHGPVKTELHHGPASADPHHRPVQSDPAAGPAEQDLLTDVPPIVQNEGLPPPRQAMNDAGDTTFDISPQVVEEPVTEEAAPEPKVVAPKTAAKQAKAEKVTKAEKFEATVQSPQPKLASVEPAALPAQGGGDCAKGEEEAKRARASISEADKLFYYRRALRLCPGQARYHVEIGGIYASIGRGNDAEYEYRQALDLDPSNAEARERLASLQKENRAN